MYLILDVHKAQKTEAVQALLDKCSTDTTYIPGGCTSLIQPLDVSFNKPFKNTVEWLATEHMQENLEAYGKVNSMQVRDESYLQSGLAKHGRKSVQRKTW